MAKLILVLAVALACACLSDAFCFRGSVKAKVFPTIIGTCLGFVYVCMFIDYIFKYCVCMFID